MPVLVAVPPILVGLVAITHPPGLSVEDAEHWKHIHVVLLFLFPLLAVGPVLIARTVAPWLTWVVAVPAYLYATTYTALDVLAGIGGGALKEIESEGVGIILPIAGDFEEIGGIAFIATSALAAGIALWRVGWVRGALPSLSVVAGAWLLWQHHVFPPEGVIAMALQAIGWVAFAVLLTRKRAPQAA